MTKQAKLFVAVTGAQGVGKSTFCADLIQGLEKEGFRATLRSGLGETLTAQGYTMGKRADERAVNAVVLEHLRREREASSGIVLLDRCLVDMLAYKRVLNVTPSPLADVYEEIVRVATERIRLIVFLETSDTFKHSSASHEDAEFRERIDAEIQAVIRELDLPVLSLDAAQPDSIGRTLRTISAIEGAHLARST